MRFQTEDETRRTGRRRPPPNYFARGVQVRLLALVGLLMFAIMAMYRAGDPSTWAWMWGESGEQAGEDPTGEVDTRLAPPPATPFEPGVIRTQAPVAALDRAAPGTAAEGAARSEESGAGGSPLERAREDLWGRFVGGLKALDQQQLDLSLADIRLGRELSEQQREHWTSLLGQAREFGRVYLQNATQGTEAAALSEAERGAWQQVLDQLQEAWSDDVRALDEVTTESPGESVRLRLAAIEGILDRISFGAIKDNSVMRTPETRAWFALFARLREQTPQALGAGSRRVGFVELFRQPQAFRGEPVTFHGHVKKSYHVEAPRNVLDVPGYYVLWIRPAVGPASPMVAYCLEVPEGFPVGQESDPGGDLNEEVTIHGYFFKNWAYRAKDGINTAPLVLARAPVWQPQGPTAAPPVSWTTVGILSALVLAAGCGVIALAYIAGRRQQRPAAPDESLHLAQLGEEVLPDARGRLGQLERSETPKDVP